MSPPYPALEDTGSTPAECQEAHLRRGVCSYGVPVSAFLYFICPLLISSCVLGMVWDDYRAHREPSRSFYFPCIPSPT